MDSSRIKIAEPTPRLSDACRAYVGHTFALRFYCRLNACWTQVIGTDIIEYPDMFEMEGIMAQVIPVEFFSQRDATTRGFRGTIATGDHRFSGFYVVAAPGISGTEFNFTDTPCSEWRVWLSQQELPAPTLAFRQLRGVDMVAGYGSIYDPSFANDRNA